MALDDLVSDYSNQLPTCQLSGSYILQTVVLWVNQLLFGTSAFSYVDPTVNASDSTGVHSILSATDVLGHTSDGFLFQHY